jgi:hypothetical protein
VVHAPTDPTVPWTLLADIWRTDREGHAGFVERAARPLRDWLGAHPHRRRYRFELIIHDGPPARYVLLGVGRMPAPSSAWTSWNS